VCVCGLFGVFNAMNGTVASCRPTRRTCSAPFFFVLSASSFHIFNPPPNPPHTQQMFVANSGKKPLSERDFDREMFRVRKLIEAEAELSPHLKDLFVCSLSNQTLTYKGQLTPEQLYGYYGDLQVRVSLCRLRVCVCACVASCLYACVPVFD
jgi:hypothetical protein